jgi:hypothetical protein
MYTFIFGFKI